MATATPPDRTPSESASGPLPEEVDVVVVGAGFAGLYLHDRLRELGYSHLGFDAADDVGGTWYWNRYPGARCDVESLDYSYSFDPELDAEWEWSERYATQPEILEYLGYVADRHDLRRHVRFSTRVDRAEWDDDARRWQVTTDRGDTITCRWYVMASGCLSVPKIPDIPGVERFTGPTYSTGTWPHEGVDFTGRRVAVIGTGSSAIQSIPLIASQAAELTVFQRTPNFSIPAHNGPVDAAKKAEIEADRAAYRERARQSRTGVPGPQPEISALAVSDEERRAAYEEAWAQGGLFSLSRCFNDLGANQAANDTVAEFIRSKIRDIVDDPETADKLCPTDYPYGTKRPCLDDDYFATYNQDHVHLVDLRAEPITTITETGIDTDACSHEFDDIVFATGFDAMTGALVSVDIRGRDDLTLADAWAQGPRTYLGLMSVGFPNLFMVTGPGSPSVLSNMVVSIEQHVEWITDTLDHLRQRGLDTIEPTPTAEEGWARHVTEYAEITLFPKANSWYMGANVPGKPRMFLPYVGGVDRYRRICDRVVAEDYLGFRLRGDDAEACNDGVVCRLKPDVEILLETMAALDLPPIESLSPEQARAFMEAAAEQRPPGPEVGEIVDGTLPGAAGELDYRLYRPDGPGPHPLVIYFHGGGWVLGHATSDEPLCRDLCVRSGAAILSVDYRHAPENRFPAAVEDALAATRWAVAHAEELGGDPARLLVAGWSAGGNLAAVVAQHVRGEIDLAGQVLLTPATDGARTYASQRENAEGYVLTAALMAWFWDHYLPEAEGDRSDPLASPLRTDDLSGLPPTLIVTAEFDPLRDEGAAYAEALTAAGNEVEHHRAMGHTHTSPGAVDVLPSSVEIRDVLAGAIRRFAKAAEPI